MEGLVIAIDGPAGSGKSSVARAVAEELGLANLNTGAALSGEVSRSESCLSRLLIASRMRSSSSSRPVW